MKGNDTHLSDMVQQWGNAFSIALFDPKTNLFNTPSVDGLLGYRSISNTLVVFGEPVCAADDMPLIAGDFFHYCRDYGKNAIFVAISSQFLKYIKSHHPACSLQVGDEIILDPTINIKEQTGPDARRLRNKYNQAVREAVTIKEYKGHDILLESALEQISLEWIQNRKGPQIFQQHINLFENRLHKRWFYAEYKNTIAGLIVLNKIRQGWVLNIAMMSAQAPRYLSEFMILELLDILKNEGCEHLSIGLIPSTHLGGMDGMGFISKKFVQSLYKIARRLFKLNHRQQFWKKFKPNSVPMHIAFSGSKVKITDAIALIRAFNGRI